jgi:hypothetical protein
MQGSTRSAQAATRQKRGLSPTAAVNGSTTLLGVRPSGTLAFSSADRSASNYVRIQLTATPLAGLLQHQPERPGQRLAQVLTADVATALQPHQTAGGLAFRQEAHVLVADR